MLEIQAVQPQRGWSSSAGKGVSAVGELTCISISPQGALQSLNLVSPQGRTGLGLHLEMLPAKSKCLWLRQHACLENDDLVHLPSGYQVMTRLRLL